MFTSQMVVFWAVVFLVQHYVLITPFMHAVQKLWAPSKHWHELSPKDKWWYTSYINAIVHAFISMMGSVYAALYADGKPGTLWWNDAQFRHTMFPVQIYLQLLSLGYIIFDFILCLLLAEKSGLMMQTYLHHVLAIAGAVGGAGIQGLFGSLS